MKPYTYGDLNSSNQLLEAFLRLIDERLDAALVRHATRHPQNADDTPGPAGQTFVNKKEAARLLSCSTGTVDNMARAGRLKRHYVGKKAVRFLRGDVLAIASGTPEKNR